jgi:hypothetical protein
MRGRTKDPDPPPDNLQQQLAAGLETRCNLHLIRKRAAICNFYENSLQFAGVSETANRTAKLETERARSFRLAAKFMILGQKAIALWLASV